MHNLYDVVVAVLIINRAKICYCEPTENCLIFPGKIVIVQR